MSKLDAHQIDQILQLHKMWLNDDDHGKCADLRGADLIRADLRGADLRGADLICANLIGADLIRADLRGANLSGADLRGADLIGANLIGANLRGADLRSTNLRGADLIRADLIRADLRGADLSGATGLLSPQYWLGNFQTDRDGVLVFKKIGKTQYSTPAHWNIEPGSVLTEECSPCRTIDCACGVNFGTRAWCEANYYDADLWLCRIRWIDLAGVVVPYNTDGKARCNRLELVENLGPHHV